MTDLTIIVPVLNEVQNIAPFCLSIQRALSNCSWRWEILFVDDDSKDGTAEAIEQFANENPFISVRLIRRIHRYGLSSACIEGILASLSSLIVVMDVDGQHDETLLPQMMAEFQNPELDLVIASRYIEGGSTGSLAAKRVRVSEMATQLAQFLSKTDVTDPMSGFFMVKRVCFKAAAKQLFGQGFKILLDILLTTPGKLTIKELPYHMRSRQYGESKLNAKVVLDYFLLLAHHLCGWFFPLDFMLFILVGFIGSLFHLFVLGIALKSHTLTFLEAQSLATLVTVGINFYFNNTLTFSYQRLRGRRIYKGLLKFLGLCSLGFLLNLSVSYTTFSFLHSWVVAGLLGYIISGLWNYMCSKTSIWTP